MRPCTPQADSKNRSGINSIPLGDLRVRAPVSASAQNVGDMPFVKRCIGMFRSKSDAAIGGGVGSVANLSTPVEIGGMVILPVIVPVECVGFSLWRRSMPSQGHGAMNIEAAVLRPDHQVSRFFSWGRHPWFQFSGMIRVDDSVAAREKFRVSWHRLRFERLSHKCCYERCCNGDSRQDNLTFYTLTGRSRQSLISSVSSEVICIMCLPGVVSWGGFFYE